MRNAPGLGHIAVLGIALLEIARHPGPWHKRVFVDVDALRLEVTLKVVRFIVQYRQGLHRGIA